MSFSKKKILYYKKVNLNLKQTKKKLKSHLEVKKSIEKEIVARARGRQGYRKQFYFEESYKKAAYIHIYSNSLHNNDLIQFITNKTLTLKANV